MKIGILTFHDEFNYGSVLQAYALQEHLCSLGYEVVFLNHHVTHNDSRIKGILSERSARSWLRFIILSLVGSGTLARQVRLLKSSRFIRRYLRTTSYRFDRWEDAPRDLGVDLIIVGSDQLWSCQWESPEKYLLIGAPKIPAITYAVSIGVSSIPSNFIRIYQDGLRNFSAISVRENRAMELLHQINPNIDISHVVDPTILVKEEVWDEFRGVSTYEKLLVCYLMGEDINECLKRLIPFAKLHKCRIKIFADRYLWVDSPINFSTFPFVVFKILKRRVSCWLNNVSILISASPREFIREISSASYVVSDSFHALMFSIIYRKNIRVLRPRSDYRGKMFSRIEEVCNNFVCGPVVKKDIDEALQSFLLGEQISFNEVKIKSAREFSNRWLERSIAKVQL